MVQRLIRWHSVMIHGEPQAAFGHCVGYAIREEHVRWGSIIREAGLRLE
jgi:hypothetical protein